MKTRIRLEVRSDVAGFAHQEIQKALEGQGYKVNYHIDDDILYVEHPPQINYDSLVELICKSIAGLDVGNGWTVGEMAVKECIKLKLDASEPGEE